MIKYLYFFYFFLFYFSAIAQNDIVVKGTVIDINTQLPLELATVYFTTVKDSTVIEYAITDKSGFFSIKTKKYNGAFFLKVNYLGYQPYIKEENDLLKNMDFGKLYLLENVNVLDNVVIKSETPPITIRKDTLEFNASSFKVRPDANVKTLLKQLPGFDVESDGKIFVNGREVNQVLVNGKVFFDKDGAIALKNLPAEIINKIQVSDFKTKKEELAKQKSTSDYSSINITIDKKKNKGIFGKILGGYGSDNRYESSLLLNYFDTTQRVSVLASSNNVNSSGFSQDEVFDNMRGGRNSLGISGGSSLGITQSNLAGFNYSGDWSDNFTGTGNYNFLNSITNNDHKFDKISLLPTGNIATLFDSKTKNENTGNNANFELDYTINPTTELIVSPKVNLSRSNSNSFSSSLSKDGKGNSLNESNAKSYSESTNIGFGYTINFNKTFKKEFRNFSLVFDNNSSSNASERKDLSKTVFYQDNSRIDDRNQKNLDKVKTDAYSFELEYTEPLTNSLRIKFGSDFDYTKDSQDAKTFDFNTTTQSYSDLNESLTNFTTSKQNSVGPKAGVIWEKSKFNINLNSSTAIVQFDNHALYLNNVTDLNKKYALPLGNLLVDYKLSRSKNLIFKYDYSNVLPTGDQLMPVLNLSNPLNTIVGNPDLKPIEKNSVFFNFKSYNFRARSAYNLYIKGDYYNNEVVSTSIYDESGKSTTTYVNISGAYAASVGGSWNQSIKKDAHVFRYNLGLNASYSFDKGFTNAILYDAKSLAVFPKVNFTYEYGELLIISPSYDLSYNKTKFGNSSRNASSNVVHRVSLETTCYWPANLIFGNDLGYIYNSNISDNFKKDFYLWNISLSYGFFAKKLYAKIKAYDILNQNQSTKNSISATSISNEENTVLKRYIMFSLSYKIENFAGVRKKKKTADD